MKTIILGLLLLIAQLVFATDLKDYDKIKTENAPIYSECVDLSKMTKNEIKSASEIFEKYRSSDAAKASTEEIQKGLNSSLQAIGLKNEKVLFIFRAHWGFETQPGMAFRSEVRSNLSQKVGALKKDSELLNGKSVVVRFTDECHIPDRCNDYAYYRGLKSKLMKFGCK